MISGCTRSADARRPGCARWRDPGRALRGRRTARRRSEDQRWNAPMSMGALRATPASDLLQVTLPMAVLE